MDLNKLFGSSTKVDILKYLVFKRQGISMRALEAELDRTFPAIKKQITSLEVSKAIRVNKDNTSRSIHVKKDFQPIIHNLFLYTLEKDLQNTLETYSFMIHNYFLGKTFGNDIEADIVLIHQNCEPEQVEQIKNEIWIIFRKYFIDMVYITCMSTNERQQRYRLADRFVLRIMRATKPSLQKS